MWIEISSDELNNHFELTKKGVLIKPGLISMALIKPYTIADIKVVQSLIQQSEISKTFGNWPIKLIYEITMIENIIIPRLVNATL